MQNAPPPKIQAIPRRFASAHPTISHPKEKYVKVYFQCNPEVKVKYCLRFKLFIIIHKDNKVNSVHDTLTSQLNKLTSER